MPRKKENAKAKRIEIYVEDGAWFPINRKGDKLFCCDCGLVHDVELKIEKNTIFMRASRDNKMTKAHRMKLLKAQVKAQRKILNAVVSGGAGKK